MPMLTAKRENHSILSLWIYGFLLLPQSPLEKLTKKREAELFWDRRRTFSAMVLHCQQLNCFTIKDHYIKTRKWLFTQKPWSFISMITIWAKFVFLLFVFSAQMYFSVFLCFCNRGSHWCFLPLVSLIIKCIILWHSIEEFTCTGMLELCLHLKFAYGYLTFLVVYLESYLCICLYH